MRRTPAVIVLAAMAVACGGEPEQPASAPAEREPVPVAEPTVTRPPVTVDTVGGTLSEMWFVAVPRARQADETRRLVVHLEADLAPMPGFGSAALLASGDGSSLLLVVSWADSAAAASGDGARCRPAA